MAIEKQINIVVKETGLDQVQKQVNKLDASLENLSDTNKGVAKSMGESSGAVLDNGGAMGLLNDATGGLAMTVKDAVEASVLFTKSQKLSAMWQGVYTTVVGTSTGAMKAFRIALASTGIGLIVIGLGLLIANFDKVKKAVLAFIPGLSIIGDIFTSLVQTVTDFVGATSDASRELDKLGAQAENTLKKNKFALDAYGDTYDQYTKRKIEANNKYAQHVKDINEDETLSEKQKLERLKILRETANREIDKAEQDRVEERNKKAKEAQDKLDEANKAAAEKAKQDKLKADEDAKKALDEKIKNDAQKSFELDQEQKQSIADITEFRNSEIEKREDKEIEAGSNTMARIQGEYDAEKKASDDKIFLDNEVKNAKVDIAMQTLSLISEIAGQGSKVAKAIAITQATVSGVQGVQNAFTTASASPVTTVFPAYPFIQAGLAGAFSALQIAKIAKGEKAGSTSAGGGSSSTPSAPSFNLVQGTSSNQIASSINTQQPIEAFVVSKNVSTGQELDRNIIKSASL